jgi:acyl carrier protein
MVDILLVIINEIRANKQQEPLATLSPDLRLHKDVGFESLDLAELTVRIEARFGVDVFADGVVHTVGEVQAKLPFSLPKK